MLRLFGFVLFFSLFSSGVSAKEDLQLRASLSPEMPILGDLTIPLLHEVMAEHHLSGDGLTLEPEAGPYAWTKIGPSDEPFRLRVGVDAAHYERGTLTVWNWYNHAVAQWQIEGGSEGVLELAVEGYGTYLLTFDAWRGDGYQKRLIRNVGVTADLNSARASWKKDEFYVGLCAFPGRYHWKPGGEPTLPAGLDEEEARNLEAELIARLGLQVVRTDESAEMGRKKGADGDEYFFDFRRMDAAVNSYTSRGFELVLQTMSASDWAVLPAYADRGKERWRYPHQERPQRAYIAALVERYGDRARLVQISNEPDQIGYWTGTNEEFVTQYLFSFDEVRRVAPELPVTCGGYSLVDIDKCAYFIKELYPFVDVPAYNAHGNLNDYKRSFATMRRLQAEAGDTATRWANTETGYSAWRLDQERRQAQIDAQKVLYSWANGHAGVLLFCSRMTRASGRDGTPDFGLIDYQFCPRFVYGSVAALTGALREASYRETIAEEEETHLYLFEREGELILAGFTLSDEPTSVRLKSDASAVIQLDEMGNATEVSDETPFTLTPYPRYRIYRGAQRVGRE